MENTNENLKALMGESFKDDLTLEDVNNFLAGKKYADLSSGKYVDVAKYDALNKKHNDYLESTKDYQSVKDELGKFKQQAKVAELNQKAKDSGIDERFIKLALSELNEDEKDVSKALEKWLKDNPQFAKKKDETVIINSNPGYNGNSQTKGNEKINAAIRGSFGRSN